MMVFFRVIAMALPLLLISLLVAGSKDMLGGWNQTDNALSTVLILFALGPLISLALLVTEIVGCYKTKQGERCKAFLFIGLAILVLIEALVVDFYLLTQLRM
jgi:hypothetical protein